MFLVHVVLLLYIFLASMLKIKVPEFALVVAIFMALALVVYDPVTSVLMLMAILVMRLNMNAPRTLPQWRTKVAKPSPYLATKTAETRLEPVPLDQETKPVSVPQVRPPAKEIPALEDTEKTVSQEILMRVLGDRLPTKEQLESAQTNVWNAKNMDVYINDLAQASKKGSYSAQGTSSKTGVWGYDPMSDIF